MTDTAREAQERMPVITEKHAEVMRWMAFGGIAPFPLYECERMRREVDEVVRALSSRSHVMVVREDLQDVLSLLEAAGEPNFYTHKGAVKVMREIVDRWLNPRPASTETPEK